MEAWLVCVSELATWLLVLAAWLELTDTLASLVAVVATVLAAALVVLSAWLESVASELAVLGCLVKLWLLASAVTVVV